MEYSVNAWINGTLALSLCVDAAIGTLEDAAEWGRFQAVRRGLIGKGQPCEIDISIDASEEWTTVRL